MDKVIYKELLGEEVLENSKLKNLIDKIWKLVEDEPNDMKLGSEIRKLCWETREKDNVGN